MLQDEFKLEFEKVNDIKYRCKVPYSMVDYVDTIVKKISNFSLDKFLSYITEELEDKIVSRMVSSIWFSTNIKDLPSMGFLTIDVMYKERVITVSLGELPIDENNTIWVNGVMYT